MSAGSPRDGRSWPGYLFGGRVRTSTVALIVVFLLSWWMFETYQPEPGPPAQIPATDVVPPGFIPDPAYTWVPRTDVQPPTTPTTTPTTPTTPTSGEESAPTTSGEPDSTSATPGAATTTAPSAPATPVAPGASGVPTGGPAPTTPTAPTP